MHPPGPGVVVWILPQGKSLCTGSTEINDGRPDPVRQSGPDSGPWFAKNPDGPAAGMIKPPFRPGGRQWRSEPYGSGGSS